MAVVRLTNALSTQWRRKELEGMASRRLCNGQAGARASQPLQWPTIYGRNCRLACQAGSSAVSQDMTERLAHNFFAVQNPALFNRRYSAAVTDFIDSAVLAYECGHNEESIRRQLKEHLVAAAGQLGLQEADEDGCMLAINLVWCTLMLSPKTVKRWSSASPLTVETQRQWNGFVGMIVDAYFNKRMAWYPIDRLSMEVSAMNCSGRQARPDEVAEWARIAFTTLESIYPQFPRD